ncbi:unnamed protein product [Adineta ricciae]|uniref:C2 domain-containing protein n=1 Tax=Adineta ricciae TaxID=249248 RepID=A0A815PTR3_ADIRI|nr:unnamed protein product [Adineta ricciae]CAF1452994.1 unnamed protein product [Adineta ricciae]
MGQLEVTVVEGRNFKQKDTFSANDAYVKIYLDEKTPKEKTKTKLNSNNPTWNQTFFFNHFYGQDTLHLDIYDKDAIKDEKIGAVQIDLHQLYLKGHIDDWFDIPDAQGQIRLILHYERLEI